MDTWIGGSFGRDCGGVLLGKSTVRPGCVVLIELGFLLAYRSGWDIGVAALYSNAATALVLLPVGLWVYAGGIDARKALGLAFASVGLVLLSGSPTRADEPQPAAPAGPSSS